MAKSRDEIINEFFMKGISPTLDGNEWKMRPTELSDLAAQAKLYKVYLIVENAIALENPHREELRFIAKQWVILK